MEQFQDILNKTEQLVLISHYNITLNSLKKSHFFATAINRLIHNLMRLDVVINLFSKIGNQDLTSNLLALHRYLQKEDLDYIYFRVLSRPIINYVSNTDIWGAVFNIVNTLLCVIFSTTIASTFDDTSVTYSLSFFEDSEQIRKNLKPKLFYKINNCMYQNVIDFFDKYFKEKSWSRKNKKANITMKIYRKCGR